MKENYTAQLNDNRFGSVRIVYDEGYGGYLVNADLVKSGETVLTLTAPNGTKQAFDVLIDEDGAHVSAT